MAEYLGVDRSSVSRMENGQPMNGPVIRLLRALAASPPPPPHVEANADEAA